MHNLTDSFISKEVVDSAAAHGFTIEVTIDESADSPRHCGVSSTFVGGTRGVGSGVCDEQLEPSMHGNCMQDAVINYARAKGLDVNDLMWHKVFSFGHGNIALSLQPFECRFDGGVGGFIFESKKAIREEFGVKRISSKVREKVERRLQLELEELSDWTNGEVYEVCLLDECGDVVSSCSNIFDYNNYIEDVARELILEAEPA